MLTELRNIVPAPSRNEHCSSNAEQPELASDDSYPVKIKNVANNTFSQDQNGANSFLLLTHCFKVCSYACIATLSLPSFIHLASQSYQNYGGREYLDLKADLNHCETHNAMLFCYDKLVEKIQGLVPSIMRTNFDKVLSKGLDEKIFSQVNFSEECFQKYFKTSDSLKNFWQTSVMTLLDCSLAKADQRWYFCTKVLTPGIISGVSLLAFIGALYRIAKMPKKIKRD